MGVNRDQALDVVWIGVGEQTIQERVSKCQTVYDYGIDINGGYCIGAGVAWRSET